jgi:hypothetical protein
MSGVLHARQQTVTLTEIESSVIDTVEACKRVLAALQGLVLCLLVRRVLAGNYGIVTMPAIASVRGQSLSIYDYIHAVSTSGHQGIARTRNEIRQGLRIWILGCTHEYAQWCSVGDRGGSN